MTYEVGEVTKKRKNILKWDLTKPDVTYVKRSLNEKRKIN